jgi:hypothetical protein
MASQLVSLQCWLVCTAELAITPYLALLAQLNPYSSSSSRFLHCCAICFSTSSTACPS